MRRLHCDHDEFHPGSEQTLDLVITSTRGYRDLAAFLADDRVPVQQPYPAAGAVAAPPRWPKWDRIIEHLVVFAGIDLSAVPPREVQIYADEGDWLAVAASVGDWYFWYSWQTTA